MAAKIMFILGVITMIINIRTFYVLHQVHKRLDADIKRLDELTGGK